MPRRFGTGLVDEPGATSPAGPQQLPSASRSHFAEDPVRPWNASTKADAGSSTPSGLGSSPTTGPQPWEPHATSRFVGASSFGGGVSTGVGPVDLSRDLDPGQDGLVPQLGLPKGGGALRGIGERFDVNAFTGTGGLTIPVYSSPSRDGGPQLALSYDSGAGQGPFGLGMRLSPPSITRRTDRGLPRYLDRSESDAFVWSGADHLVPMLDAQGEARLQRSVTEDGEVHTVLAYRPRVEDGFARIERWVPPGQGRSFWRVTDGNNVVSTYGRSPAAKISDPDAPHRVFTWLLERVEDDRGNIAVYEYAVENRAGVNTSAAWERSRGDAQANRYLKRIRYGNRTPFVADDFLFEVVFDYGEHGELPAFDEPESEGLEISVDPTRPWAARPDPFSNYRATFEIRTYRRCQRVLMVHRFPELNDGQPTVVASTDLYYDDDPVTSKLVAATHRGYVFDPQTQRHAARAAPPLQLEYQPRRLGQTQRSVDARSLGDLGAGLDADHLQLVDLDGEGLPGILFADHAGGWRYKRPLGDGRFGAAALQHTVPSLAVGNTAPRLMDLDGDGHLSLALFEGATPGTQRRESDGSWSRLQTFACKPNVSVDDPRARFIDLDGDGLADLLVDRGETLAWYPSLGRSGYGPAVTVPKPGQGPEAPRRIYSDPRVGLFFADMSGDGLSDLVVVRNGALSYWPNLGLGHFGQRVDMPGLSVFDHDELFASSRVRLADVDGSGAADLVYFDADGARVWMNASGNHFVEEARVQGFPRVDQVTHADLVDLTGTGTADLIWSSSLPAYRGQSLRYVELQPEGKPYLLTAVRNNLGAQTRVRYAPSTRFYLAARDSGRPWKSRLAFPVQVIERVEVLDDVTGHRQVSTYAYHHGYFDGAEREFRGFGLVEQWDAESFEHFGEPGLFPTGHRVEDEALHVPPVLTKTWFHTGAHLGVADVGRLFEDEMWAGDPDAPAFARQELPSGLSVEERREALRALRGQMLRQEVYALDGSDAEAVPYTVSQSVAAVRRLQRRVRNPPDAFEAHAAFFVHPLQTRTLHYERDVTDPRMVDELTLEVDAFGVAVRSASVAYPRRLAEFPEQARSAIVVTEVDVTHQAYLPDRHRLAVPVEQRAYEVRELSGDPSSPWQAETLVQALENAPRVPFEAANQPGVHLRLLSRRQARYYADNLSGPLPLGQAGRRALQYEVRQQAFEAQHVQALLAGVAAPEVLPDVLAEGGYVEGDGAWWVRSGRAILDAARFYLPIEVLDPFENVTEVEYDSHALLGVRVTDPVGNSTAVEPDYRVLVPWRATDPNGNVSETQFDALGQVVRFASVGSPGQEEGDSLDDPTATFEVDLFAFMREGQPAVVHTRHRERHRDPDAQWVEQYVYSDGGGNLVQSKVRAEAGLAPVRDADGGLVQNADGSLALAWSEERWVGSGREIRNNKGLPVKQYEPFFSDRPSYESEDELVQMGVTALLHYDPVGRLVRSDLPDGTLTRVSITPWRVTAHDANDTVLESRWHSEAMALPPGTAENDARRRAATLTVEHAGTPSVTHLDMLGRAFLEDSHNRDAEGEDEHRLTRAELDVQGDVLGVVDARGNDAESRRYGMMGQALLVESVDAGNRWTLSDVQGAPLRGWSSRGFTSSMRYDAARRPTHHFVREPGGQEQLVERTVYGEVVPDGAARNLRGQVFRVYDGAGLTTNERFDFEGNLAVQTRVLAVQREATPDWQALEAAESVPELDAASAGLLEAEVFELRTRHDALGRPVEQTSPDETTVEFGYNEAALLESVHARVRGVQEPTAVVEDIDYNARGQRTLVVHGNGTQTTYEYDPQSFRLRRLRTTQGEQGRVFADLHYTHDPVGNVMEVLDGAQADTYFDGAVVEGRQTFRYDAVYQLVEATGREHAQQEQPTHEAFGPQPNPHDGTALRGYTEQFEYDFVGNILQHRHVATGGGWTRNYEYAANGNHLLRNSAPGDAAGQLSHAYTYDAHGNTTSMPHLSEVQWNWADRMQWADLVGGGVVYFTYGADGQRVVKRRVSQNGNRIEERIYIGPFEVYREYLNGTLDLERETVHAGDGAGRQCMLETRTVHEGVEVEEPPTTLRYQYGNHLGSAMLELNEAASVISYEEFHPYGTSAYRAVDSTIEVSPKRYRYAAAERDEETGLDHMGLRYYAPWLGRWTSADPIGLGDGVNRYAYVHGNPVSMRDPSGTRTSRSPFSRQGSRIEAIQAQAASIRDLIGVLEEDIGTIEGVEEDIAELRGELGSIEQRGRVESAIFGIAQGPEAVADLSAYGEFSVAEQAEILDRSRGLRLQEGMFWQKRQDVARQPTTKERGMALRAEQQQVRLAVAVGSGEVLMGIEAAYAVRAGLVAVEARAAAAGLPRTGSPSRPKPSGASGRGAETSPSREIALGLGGHPGRGSRAGRGFLGRFAEKVEAYYYRQWESAGIAKRQPHESYMSERFLREGIAKADKIHFNLDQINPAKYRAFAENPSAPTSGNVTNWELHTVLNEGFAGKTTFYGPKGATMTLSEVRTFLGLP